MIAFEAFPMYRQDEAPKKAACSNKKKLHSRKTGYASDDNDLNGSDISNETSNVPNKARDKPVERGSKGVHGKPKSAKHGKKPNGTVAAEQEEDEPRWMEKYRMKDLKGGKGDLEGLYPFLVAQIIGIETEGIDDVSGMHVI